MEVKNLKETGESGDSRIRRKLLPVMSSINPDLQFTAEICEYFEDKTSRCCLKFNHTFYNDETVAPPHFFTCHSGSLSGNGCRYVCVLDTAVS